MLNASRLSKLPKFSNLESESGAVSITEEIEMQNIYPRILCAAGHHEEIGEHGSREFISASLPEYNITFANNEFDIAERARSGPFDLILMNCVRPDGRYAKACELIRMFDTKTPVVFITNSHRVTEEAASRLGAQGVVSTDSPHFAEDLRHRLSELVECNSMVFKQQKV